MAKKASTKKKKVTRKKKPATKKPAPKKSFEQTLWDTADKLRGTVESSEYKHVVLSLIFLKFVSDRFEARRQEIMDDCLLYTSPSPRDRQKSRMPSSA